MLPTRVPLKLIMLVAFVLWYSARRRVERVEEFDRRKRREQRAMQNKEAEELQNRRVTYLLFDTDGEQYSEKDIKKQNKEYAVLWYDCKMKNYQLLIKYMLEKRIAMASIKPVLVVDKKVYQDKVKEIWTTSHNMDKKEK